MSLTLLEVVAAVRARRASLSAETVGYLLLGVADHLITVPREVGAEDVFLGEEGALRIGAGRPADADRSERALRELLDALLGVASTATPALARIGRRPSGVGIEGLLRELEAALIPVNRAAAQRALNRLYRDAQRAARTTALDVAQAQAWLKRSAPPSAPVPVVEVASPPPLPHVPYESPVVALDVTPSRPRPSPRPPPLPEATPRPPPLPDQRPAFESLTRPEPVLVRAAARAQSGTLAADVGIPHLFVGTPRLGTFVAPLVHSVPAELQEPAIELEAGEVTERTPEVATEPPVLVITAPMPPCAEEPRWSALPQPEPPPAAAEPEPMLAAAEPEPMLAAAEPEPMLAAAEPEPMLAAAEPEPMLAPPPEPAEPELEDASAELASVVVEALAEDSEPLAVASELESLDDEIMIVVDSELTPVPEGEAIDAAEAALPAEADLAAAESAPAPEAEPEAETRWWSSPEPPELEVAAEPEPEPVFATVEAEPEPVPSFPALEMPSPPPAAIFEPTPLPEVDLSAVEEARHAHASPEPSPFDEAVLEAAAAEYAAIAETASSPLPAPAGNEQDFVETGWTPAPEPIAPIAPIPEPIQVAEPTPEPVPLAATPETEAEVRSEDLPPPAPAPSRFPPRRSDVSELLRGFAVTEARSDRELCRDLKLLAGVDLTPLPGTTTLR